MKNFVRVSIILGTFIIVMSIIKFQENNLKNKTKENKVWIAIERPCFILFLF